jgi:hypothetical protein
VTTAVGQRPGSEPGDARVGQGSDVEVVRFVRSPRDAYLLGFVAFLAGIVVPIRQRRLRLLG